MSVVPLHPQHDRAAAEAAFKEILRDNPGRKTWIDPLRRRIESSKASP